MTDSRVSEPTRPATPDDLRLVAEAFVIGDGEIADDIWYPGLGARLEALAAIRDKEQAVIAAADAWERSIHTKNMTRQEWAARAGDLGAAVRELREAR